MSETEIALAVATLRNRPDLNDEEVYQTLVNHGIARALAARLVEFLPGAYCRIIFENAGPRFAESFRRQRRDGTISPEIELKSEPVWNAAIAFARRDVQNGLSRDDKLRLAGRSAEFQAANSLLQQGSKLEDIVFTPSIHTWDKDGPPVEMVAPKPTRPRWRRWF